MRDYALELAARQESAHAKLNILREYLQAYVLRILHEGEIFQSTAFLGGTALRFLHGLPRFSEDLDFSLEKKRNYSFVNLLKKLKQELILAGYSVSISYQEAKTVEKANVKFAGLLHAAGLSSLPSQNLSVRIEIDTNPPEGAHLVTEIVNRYFPIAFLVHDLPSLFAGKLIALFARRYHKGRDFFDLGWYLSRWKDLVPNFILLQNGLRQSNWKGAMPSKGNWREVAAEVVQGTDWVKLKEDVERFLENPKDRNVFTKENVLQLLKRQ